LEAFFFDVANI